MATPTDLARETLTRWREHPAAMVREAFGVTPDRWQEEALEAFPSTPRLAMKACKGPGKTAVLAWLVLNFLATRPHPRIGATSITGDNLDQNLWPELAKWIGRSAFFGAAFVWTATKVESRAHPATWWCHKRTWPKQANQEQQADTLAGLHEDYVMWILDESGGIPTSVLAAAEAIFTSAVEAHLVQSGNPTTLDGSLHHACVRERDRWRVVTITGDPDDPQRSARIDVAWAREQIRLYGRDNPWVMVNVLGQFPPASINALLSVEEVEAAMSRHLRRDVYEWSQKRIGIDVARFGDDRTVLFPRQGLASFRPIVMRNARTTAIAARAHQAAAKWGAELLLVDDTGHWGHGVIDNLLTLGRAALPIIYSDKAIDPRYKNRRAEFWFRGCEAIRNGAALPNIPEMVAELVTPTYTFAGGQILIEPKDAIKERLGRSPDLADAYLQTYAIEDMPGQLVAEARGSGHAVADGDPFREARW